MHAQGTAPGEKGKNGKGNRLGKGQGRGWLMSSAMVRVSVPEALGSFWPFLLSKEGRGGVAREGSLLWREHEHGVARRSCRGTPGVLQTREETRTGKKRESRAVSPGGTSGSAPEPGATTAGPSHLLCCFTRLQVRQEAESGTHRSRFDCGRRSNPAEKLKSSLRRRDGSDGIASFPRGGGGTFTRCLCFCCCVCVCVCACSLLFSIWTHLGLSTGKGKGWHEDC